MNKNLLVLTFALIGATHVAAMENNGNNAHTESPLKTKPKFVFQPITAYSVTRHAEKTKTLMDSWNSINPQDKKQLSTQAKEDLQATQTQLHNNRKQRVWSCAKESIWGMLTGAFALYSGYHLFNTPGSSEAKQKLAIFAIPAVFFAAQSPYNIYADVKKYKNEGQLRKKASEMLNELD